MPRPGPAVLAGLGLAFIGVGLTADQPALVLLGLTFTAASPFSRFLPIDVAIGGACGTLLLAAIVVGLAASHLGVNLLAHPHLVATSYLLGAVAVCASSTRGVPRRVASRVMGPVGLRIIAFSPATFALATGLAQVVVPGLTKSWAFWGTDMPRHMITISHLQEAGSLDYGASSYPRGLHMLAALASVPNAPLGDRVALLGYDTVLAAALTWFALALMLTVGAGLCLRVASRLGQPHVVGSLAALMLGAGALLTNTFLVAFVYSGAAASLTAVCVLYGAVIVLLLTAETTHRLATVTVVCAGATLLTAHLWQALVAAPVLAWFGLASRDIRHIPEILRSRLSRRVALLSMAIALGAATLTLEPVFRVQQASGLSYAAMPGDLGGHPWRLLAAALVACIAAFSSKARRETWLWSCAAFGVGLVVTIALLLRGSGDLTNLEQYYPLKAAWFLALFLAPLLATVTAAVLWRTVNGLWTSLARTGRWVFILRSTLLGVLCGPLLAAWLGYLVGVDASAVTAWHRAVPSPGGQRMSTVEMSAVRYDIATRFGDMRGTTVVPWRVGELPFAPNGTVTTSLLFTFMTGQPEMRAGYDTLCADLDTAHAFAPNDRLLVISQLSDWTVRRQMQLGRCSGRADILRVRSVGYVD